MLAVSDSVVHQDGSIALRLLTPDERLLEVAKRLVSSGDGNLFAAVLKERMNAAERIELARALAVAGVDVLSSERADLSAAASEVTPYSDVVQAAACAATLWRDDSDEVKGLLGREPQAAALGLLEARDHGADWWDLARLAAHADLDVLGAAAVDERVIQAAKRDLEFLAMSPRSGRHCSAESRKTGPRSGGQRAPRRVARRGSPSCCAGRRLRPT
jgi:hypothetical protein